MTQSRIWNQQAADYEDLFLDPYAANVQNPLWAALDQLVAQGAGTIADLGCGTGPLLPYLAARFERVIALDFAPAMLERARSRLDTAGLARTTFLERPMHELGPPVPSLDAALSINSLVIPDQRLLDQTLRAIHNALQPGGTFLGIVPSIDAIAYHLMLLVDLALETGASEREAERLASLRIEKRNYDFALGRFRSQGLRQKFWQPFEIEYRLHKAGFQLLEISKVLYPWDESLPGGLDLAGHPRSWDWFFRART